MSVERIVELLRMTGSDEGQLAQQYTAVQLAMVLLPHFGDSVCAQMRWNEGEHPINRARHVEALRQYFDRVPGLETAYCAVLEQSPEVLESSPYFGSP